MYKKLDFKEEGKQKKAIFRNGKFHDLLMMGILVENWNQNK